MATYTNKELERYNRECLAVIRNVDRWRSRSIGGSYELYISKLSDNHQERKAFESMCQKSRLFNLKGVDTSPSIGRRAIMRDTTRRLIKKGYPYSQAVHIATDPDYRQRAEYQIYSSLVG